MDWTVISINWTLQALTHEQMLVLRNVAAQHLRQGKKAAEIYFSHDLCEGKITRKKEGVFVNFPGTFFEADLGTIGGERWTCEFLLPRGTEKIVVRDTDIVVAGKPLAGKDMETVKVDHKKATVSEEHSSALH